MVVNNIRFKHIFIILYKEVAKILFEKQIVLIKTMCYTLFKIEFNFLI